MGESENSAKAGKFEEWKEACLSSTPDEFAMESLVTQHFASLSTEVQREQSLALLISSLEYPLTDTRLRSRKAALSCLKGALTSSTVDSSSSAITLSLPLMRLVGDFLLVHCGPIVLEETDTSGDDLDEQVRDLAVKTISVLLLANTANSVTDGSESLRYRVQLSQEALKRRCAVPDDDGYHKKTEEEYDPVAPRGLAALPRSRRTVCFDLLQSTLIGLKGILAANAMDTKNDTVSMASLLSWSELSIHCLHGESDPRCLVQLLRLLADIQQTCRIALQAQFPVDALFDAVSAYYPIQFTPPKNMSHAVTREDLTIALWKTLSCTDYDAARRKAGKETMLSLTLGLIMDQLLPLEDEDPATLPEQREALMNLHSLMMVVKGDDGTVVEVEAIAQTMLEPKSLAQIALALKTVHTQTAVPGAVQSSTSSLTSSPQQVSLQCRDLIASIAFACDLNFKTEPRYWQVFVADVVSEIIRGGRGHNQWSRQDIVYLSCLAGCGGLRTMQLVLDQCLPSFLQVVTKTDVLLDEEDFAVARSASLMATALYGIAALFVAVQTTVKRLRPLVITPHPLKTHALPVMDALLLLWQKTTNKDDTSLSGKLALSSLRVALVRSIETALMVTPKESFDGETKEIERIIGYLKDLLENASKGGTGSLAVEEEQFATACSAALGVAVGESVNLEEHTDYSVLRFDSVRAELVDRVLPFMLEDVSSQWRQVVLAAACTQSKKASETVVAKITSIVIARIQGNKEGIQNQAINIEDIAAILTKGGRNASEAFQKSRFLFQLRSALLPQRTMNLNLCLGVSALELPAPAEESAREAAEIDGLISLMEPLLPLYTSHMDSTHFNDLFVATSKVIPPLEPIDMKIFGVLLPFLSAALQNSSVSSTDELEESSVAEMISFLPDFILSGGSAAARSYAASCLNSLLVTSRKPDTSVCPCLELLQTNVMPTILRLYNDIQGFAKIKTKKVDKVHETLHGLGEAFAFTGSIGASAIQRSASSASTADKAVTFLVDIACCGKAETVTSKDPILVDFAIADSVIPDATTYLKVTAVAAFASIISSGPQGALWKQRFSFIAWKRIRQESAVNQTPSIGLLGASAHIICSSSWKGLSSSMTSALADIILRGLSIEGPVPGAIRKVVLAAAVKLVGLKHESVENNLLAVVTGLLRSYATVDPRDTDNFLPCKLLALQALESIPTLLTTQGAISAVKPAIVSILEQAMVEKSSILRHAAVEVRNTWYVV